MLIARFLWLAPFFSFILGYLAAQLLFPIRTVITPCLIGKSVHDALILAHIGNLSIELYAQKEDMNMPPGTILSQDPAPGKKVRSHHSIRIVVSQQSACTHCPALVGMTRLQADALLADTSITPRYYEMPSIVPAGTIIGQFPAPHEPLKKPYITLYVAQKITQPIIWPNFCTKSCAWTCDVLEELGITPKIYGEADSKACIKKQHPLAGSLIVLDNAHLPHVELQIHSDS